MLISSSRGTVMFEIGDIVKISETEAPELHYHVNNSLVHWRDHFGGLSALIDVVDPVNYQVRLRGKDRNGNNFVLWMDTKFLSVVRKGLDFNG